MKWIRGYGTTSVWNPLISTVRAPSNLKEHQEKRDCQCHQTTQARACWSLDVHVNHRQTLGEQASQTRTSATATSIESHEALQASAIVCQLADPVQTMSAFSLQSVYRPRAKLLAASSFQRSSSQGERTDGKCLCETHGSRWATTSTNTHRSTCLPAPASEKNVLNASSPQPMVAIRLDTMGQAEQLQSITDVDIALADVDADDLTHCCKENVGPTEE